MKKKEKIEDIASLSIDHVRNFKCYGPVKSKKGYTFYRNYNRELKNGKGKSSFDLCLDAMFRPNSLWKYLQERIIKDEEKQHSTESIQPTAENIGDHE